MPAHADLATTTSREDFRALAADVRTILGSGTKISYAADWSEYFGHQPPDGSGDVHFHLDPLWADESIDFIGIDNYVPLSDWRDGFDHLDAPVLRVCDEDVPLPYAANLEKAAIIDAPRIVEAVRKVCYR